MPCGAAKAPNRESPTLGTLLASRFLKESTFYHQRHLFKVQASSPSTAHCIWIQRGDPGFFEGKSQIVYFYAQPGLETAGLGDIQSPFRLFLGAYPLVSQISLSCYLFTVGQKRHLLLAQGAAGGGGREVEANGQWLKSSGAAVTLILDGDTI